MSDAQTLSISRLIQAPRAIVWRCWVEPALLMQWFCPKPWWVARAEIDVRPGGASLIEMRGPNGEVNSLPGQYLAVVEERHLAFSDAFVGDWRPGAQAPFMVGFVDLSDVGAQTQMVWGARHWRSEDRDAHLAMGFEAGWNAAADQLNELARSLTQAP